MRTRTLTNLFNTYKLKEDITALAEQLENDAFSDEQLESIERNLYALRIQVEEYTQVSEEP